ncbi:MAG: hypothetical protein D3926_15315 [Desulfobacteraceae bacterium]|nr:MAG: hypothetical protein D3926_15315 [Desulfobacteraceae bacterium]
MIYNNLFHMIRLISVGCFFGALIQMIDGGVWFLILSAIVMFISTMITIANSNRSRDYKSPSNINSNVSKVEKPYSKDS